MRFRTPILAATLLTLGGASLASSANVVITLKNGQTYTFNINDVKSLVYTADNVNVSTPAPPVKVMNWAGVWRTDDGSIGVITMTLNGNVLTGTYPHKNGRITGTVNGNTFTGDWVQDNAKGGFKMTLAADGKNLQGSWNYAGSNTWNGFKAWRQ